MSNCGLGCFAFGTASWEKNTHTHTHTQWCSYIFFAGHCSNRNNDSYTQDGLMPPEYSDSSEDDSDSDCMYDVSTLQKEFSVYYVCTV